MWWLTGTTKIGNRPETLTRKTGRSQEVETEQKWLARPGLPQNITVLPLGRKFQTGCTFHALKTRT